MTVARTRAALKRHALGLPGAWEDHPWGEDVAKVGKKVFVFMGVGGGDRLQLTVKLPASREPALSLPFVRPAGYGLDRGGWVSMSCEADEIPPDDVLRSWIEESYRAVAPRTRVAELEAGRSVEG
jgi:predicted DNA-binding protein (MmcQ/YjbR family)